ncbi:MAG: response regulator [Rhizobiaceae bacterium]|nr:response regulator [Rhizobiaceae bacterium]
MNTQATKIKLLFVDDDPTEFDIMKRLCRDMDHQKIDLVCRHSVEEACEVLGEQDIDMILLDNQLMMDDDFRSSTPKLRAQHYTGPIGIVSSNVRTDYFQDIEEYGADFRIGKDELDRQTIFYIINEFAPKNVV